MWCVIPAAGFGTRLEPLTLQRPKPLIELDGRPILDHLLENLAAVAKRACVVVRESDRSIRDAIGDRRHGLQLHYAEQKQPLGVADAVAQCGDLVDAPFVVAMGDVYFEESLAPYIDVWRDSGADGAVLVEQIGRGDAGDMGLVWLEGDRVVKISKQRFTGQAQQRVCGLMILPERAIRTISQIRPDRGHELELEDVVTRLLNEGAEFLAVPYRGWRRNINTMEDLEEVRARIHRTEPPSVGHQKGSV